MFMLSVNGFKSDILSSFVIDVEIGQTGRSRNPKFRCLSVRCESLN